MNALFRPFATVLRTVEKRFRVSRPGSVLILVVALLVLMALIGTAYISTTRIDRYSIRKNVAVNQLGMAADSAIDMTINAVTNDLFNGNDYRGVTTDPQLPSTYDNWDGTSSVGPSMNTLYNGSGYTPDVMLDPNDSWLSARFPRTITPINPTSGQPAPGTNNPIIWDSISYPPFANSTPAPAGSGLAGQINLKQYPWQFDSPDNPDNSFNKLPMYLSLRKLWFEPTFKQVNGVWYPALKPRHPVTGPGNVTDFRGVATGGNFSFLAADADGDGIADAGLFRLPMGDINGIRYYAAVRIIDNNSAINVNTAWVHGDMNYRGEITAQNAKTIGGSNDTTDKINTWYFPSSVDMGSLFKSYPPQAISSLILNAQGEEMSAINLYRWHAPLGPTGLDTHLDPDVTNFPQLFQWIDNQTPFAYYTNDGKQWPTSLYDSMDESQWMELGRRIDNPGWNYDKFATLQGLKPMKTYQSFGIEDQMALLYHFCLINPNINRSPLENLFFLVGSKQTPQRQKDYDSIYASASNYGTKTLAYPQTLAAVAQWYQDNFEFDTEVQVDFLGKTRKGTYHSRRPFLVTANPVSNQMPRRDMSALWDVGAGFLGSGTNWQVPGPVTIKAIALNNASGIISYNGVYTIMPANPVDSWNVNPTIPWDEQMPMWSKQVEVNNNAAGSQVTFNMPEYIPTKASANTARFGELWRAYWNVFAEGDGTKTPFDRGITTYCGGAATARAASPATAANAGEWGARYSGLLPTDGPALNDPYVGQKFWGETARTAANGIANVPKSFLAESDSYHDGREVPPNFDPNDYNRAIVNVPHPHGFNPARMFRSSIRTIPYALPAGDSATAPVTINNAIDGTTSDAGIGGAFDNNSVRFPPMQEMLLRAALAAVNLEDLRDSDFDRSILDRNLNPIDDPSWGSTPTADRDQRAIAPALIGHGTGDVTAHRIQINAVLKDPQTWTTGAFPHKTADTNAIAQACDVVVYGNEKQPFITEVFASTYANQLNPSGYVAIELYNPYDQDIEMTNWKLVAIDRRHDTNRGPLTANSFRTQRYGITLQSYPHNGSVATASRGRNSPDSPQLIADFDPDRQLDGDQVIPRTVDSNNKLTPLIVPAHGYLLLENYCDPSLLTGGAVDPGVAKQRPAVTGLPQTATIPNCNLGTDRSRVLSGNQWISNNKRATLNLPQLNVACVPGLSGLSDPVWAVNNAGTAENWQGIRSVFNRELVLLRPRRADGKYSRGFYPPLFDVKGNVIATPLYYDENWSLADLVPVDSFDFTGLQLPTGATPGAWAGATNGTFWHYDRQNANAIYNAGKTDGTSVMEPGLWRFVYPGRYDACPASGTTWTQGIRYPGGVGTPIWGAHIYRSRQQGVETDDNPGPNEPTTWSSPTAITLGCSSTGTATSNENPSASYPTRFVIQLHGDWQSNPVVPTAFGALENNGTYHGDIPSPAKFPYGGLARNGDLEQVPFIGAYRVSWIATPQDFDQAAAAYPDTLTPTRTIQASPPPGDYNFLSIASSTRVSEMIELNSITADAVFAEDTDLDDDPREQLHKSAKDGNTVVTADPNNADIKFTGNVDTDVKFWNTADKWFPDDATSLGREQIGRFCPVYTLIKGGDTRFGISAPAVRGPVADYVDNGLNPPQFAYHRNGQLIPLINQDILIDDFGYDPSFRPFVDAANPQIGADWEPYWRYPFANKLFSYLTVQAPHDDAMNEVPAQPWWQHNTDYTVGQVVTYVDRSKTIQFGPFSGKPNPLYMQPCVYVCVKSHNSGFRFPMGYETAGPAGSTALNLDPPNWHMVLRLPLANSTSVAGNSVDATKASAEYAEGVQGLINVNTANWKVLATLPLIVSPRTGLNCDPYAYAQNQQQDAELPVASMPNIISRVTGKTITYRQLNEELAKAIAYYRDVDGQPQPAGTPRNGFPSLYIPHGPFKSIYELNQVVDLRRQVDFFDQKDAGNPNPFYGHGFFDGMGSLGDQTGNVKLANANPAMAYFDPTNPPLPDSGIIDDPTLAVTDLSTPNQPGSVTSGAKIYTPNPLGLVTNDLVLITSLPPTAGDGVVQVATITDPNDFTYTTLKGATNTGTPGPVVTVRKLSDGVRGDFEEQFLQLNRISNLITTRSDTFTAYICVQGWRNAGTTNPQLVVQKRAAYILDRSRMPYEPVKKTLVPND